MAKPVRYCVCAAIAFLLVAGVIWKWPFLDKDISPLSDSNRMQSQILPTETDQTTDEIENPWFRTKTVPGIRFRHDSGTSQEKPFPSANGSGIAALDFDLDGLCDLYFVTGTPFPVDVTRAEPSNHFYRNLGSWEFQDASQEAGLGYTGYSAGVTFGDYNSDGFPDVYVACYGANVLYRNQGDGTFAPLSPLAGASDERWATSAAMFDFDGDGNLDIYVCNYGKWTLESNSWCGTPELRHYCSPKTIEPEVDVLLRNNGDDTFADITASAGLAERTARSQGVIAADLDDDGTVDIYVGNDLNANSFYLNTGNGLFRDASESSGVAYDYLGGMQAGMGVDAADTNGDGIAELIVTNFAREHNAFYESVSTGVYHEVSQQRGLYSDGLPWVGWGTAFADFDLDGWLDLVITNGHVDDNRLNVPYTEPPLLWKNNGGRRFVFIGEQAGDYFARDHVGRALVVADLDNDGDQDIVVGHQDSPPALLQNEQLADANTAPQSIVLRLVGTTCNRNAIGTKITVRQKEHAQVRQVKGGGSYLSAHDVRKFFAAGGETGPLKVEIRWADGNVSVLDDLHAGSSYTVIQPTSPSGDTRVFPIGRR